MGTETLAGLQWSDATTAGGDELRATSAHELAGMLADALRILADPEHFKPAFVASATAAAARIGYYLDIVRYGETAAIAIEQARDASRDGNFSTAQHLEAIESVLANAGASRGSSLSTYELARFAYGARRVIVFDRCDLMGLVRDAERAAGVTAPAGGAWDY